MAGQDVFKGALGWDDWVWWLIIGGVALLILLLLVCCCVCVQRAKRKGHEQALASVQRRQREAEQRRAQQQQFAQLQQQQAAASAVAPPPHAQADAFGHQYAKPVNAVPLAPPPGRKHVMGPQVAANGYLQPQSQSQQPFPPYQQQQPPFQQQYVQPQAPYAQQQYGNYPPPAPAQAYAAPAAAPAAYRAPPPPQHQEQFQKPYPPLPQQQQQQRPQPPPAAVQFHEPEKEAEAPPKPMKRRYHPPPRWYNALAANEAAAAAASEPAHAASPSSASNHNAFEDDAAAHEHSVDSIRYDPYGAQGNLNSSPFVSVTSPTATKTSKSRKKQQPALAKTTNGAAASAAQLPPPVVVATKYQSAPSMAPSSAASVESRYAGPRGGSEVVNSRATSGTSGTLADRINALREGKVESMAHSRVSDLHDRDFPSPSSAISASAFASFKTNSSAERRAPAVDARRSGVLVGSLLSPGSSSTRSAGTSTSGSARRRDPEKLVDDSFDAELLSSGAPSTSTATTSQRDVMSLGSNFSHGQFEDADDHQSHARRPAASRDSVEF